jgi:hypothetical protein
MSFLVFIPLCYVCFLFPHYHLKDTPSIDCFLCCIALIPVDIFCYLRDALPLSPLYRFELLLVTRVFLPYLFDLFSILRSKFVIKVAQHSTLLDVS